LGPRVREDDESMFSENSDANVDCHFEFRHGVLRSKSNG
jgi:hypothetical protein